MVFLIWWVPPELRNISTKSRLLSHINVDVDVKYFGFNIDQPWVMSRRRWHEDRQLILDFNRSLTLIEDPDSLMASIAARIEELFRLERVVVLRALVEPGMLTVAFSTDSSGDELERIKLFHEDRLIKWLLTNESALIVEKDKSVFDYLTEAEREMLKRLNVCVCVPLLALNHLTGVMLMCSGNKKWKLSEYETSLLQVLMGSASIALENAFLYQEQRDRLRRLYRAERLAAAGQLAASVAHEVRNPLTSIRSTVQYLLAEFDEGNQKRELVKGVISEVDRIDKTVDGLLGLTGSTDFKPETIALGAFIQQMLLLVERQGYQQSVTIEWSGPTPDLWILGDASQLKQLFLNLLLNALQSMPNGGNLTVDLNLESQALRLAGEKSCARINVTDTGCGIPAEHLDRIFDPFFTTKKSGTGLGLYTSYAIAEQHGAQLEVSSRTGEGTTVSVHFPLTKPESAASTGRSQTAK